MKIIYYVLLLAFFAFSCEKSKETVQPKDNSKEIATVLASYGYKPIKDLPSDVQMPVSITLDEFKKKMADESKVLASLSTPDANLFSQNRRTSGQVYLASSDRNTVTQDQYPNGLYVRFNFPSLKSIGWPCQYEGFYRSYVYTGAVVTAFYPGLIGNWGFAIKDNTVMHNQPKQVGFLNSYYTVGGIAYEKHYTVWLHVWFNYTQPGTIPNFTARIQYAEI